MKNIIHKVHLVRKPTNNGENDNYIPTNRGETLSNGVQPGLKPRKLNDRVRLVFLSVPDGSIMEEGSGKVCHISLSKLLVSNIKLPTPYLLVDSFQVAIFIQEGILQKIHMLCSVRKLVNNNGHTTLDLNIDKIPDKHRIRVLEFLRK